MNQNDGNSGKSLHDFVNNPTPKKQGATPPPSSPPTPVVTKEDKEKKPLLSKEGMLRALWTTTSIISMTVNVVLVIVVAFVVINFPKDYTLPDGVGVNSLNDLLQGLYENFELMDDASIKTEIAVVDEIPVVFDLNLNTETAVILSEDVLMRGVYVSINTGTIIINAPADITLPVGTVLPVFLELVVPVNEMVPVNLNVAVDIPLEETELHEPFVGLKDVVQPLYCLVAPRASSIIDGASICE